MLTLSAKIRKDRGKKTKAIRKNGKIPAVIYGPGIKSLPLEINLQEFEKVFREAGESSLITLLIDNKKSLVLIHEIQRDPITNEILHTDFYQAPLEEKVEVTVPLIFEGEAPAVKELGGTLVKDIQEIEVKALPQNLPHEIRVNVDRLKTFDDEILIKDLKIPEGVEVQRTPDEIVASVLPPEKVEEELAAAIEEKVEEVEKVEEKKEEKEEEEKVVSEEKKKEKEKTSK